MRPFLDADYSAIEARIICWLAGEETALAEYRAGVDRYKVMASFIYGVPQGEVNKHPQRFIGKQTILGCGFGMGAAKFRADCKNKGKYDLPLGLENVAITAFRTKHKKVVNYWKLLDGAAKKAILNKGVIVTVRPSLVSPEVSFLCRDIEGMPFLLIRLPSGRKLAYPHPRVMPSQKFENGTTVVFFGNIKGTQWGEVDTYGGKFAENITQAVAADIMTNGAHNAENAGYAIATLIHDQALAFYEDWQTSDEFVSLLTDLPEWASGLPVEAEGGLVPFYKKD